MEHFKKESVILIGTAALKNGITNKVTIGQMITLTGAGLLEPIQKLPGVDGNLVKWNAIVAAGQEAYVRSYKNVYFVSIAFGGVAIIASLFLKNISQYMDDHIADPYDKTSSSETLTTEPIAKDVHHKTTTTTTV